MIVRAEFRLLFKAYNKNVVPRRFITQLDQNTRDHKLQRPSKLPAIIFMNVTGSLDKTIPSSKS